MSFAMIVHQGALPAPSWIAAWLAANAVLAGILRAGTVRLARRLHGQGRLERRVALVGAAEDGRAFLADINRRGCWWHCWCGWTSTGPVLFRQRRIGLGNRPFECLKFRTMYHDMRDVLADRQTTRGDRRVTRVGYWLRRLSLDELPQLLNVLKGEMSLVGRARTHPTPKLPASCSTKSWPAMRAATGSSRA